MFFIKKKGPTYSQCAMCGKIYKDPLTHSVQCIVKYIMIAEASIFLVIYFSILVFKFLYVGE